MESPSQNLPRENRLAGETSPYLLQHKHNPVDWWPWGPQALAEAQRANKPILLSVGYAACHWCHVMAHESFEDDATARVMNDLFVNIKVDREERPDIDQIYMSALHHLGEQGGWPLTMFLTPAGEPVWGGTYFPNTSRFGRPAFVDVLREVARLFREEPERDRAEPSRPDGAARPRGAPRQQSDASARPSSTRRPHRSRACSIRSMAACAARRNFRNAPMLEMLWRAAARGPTTLGSPKWSSSRSNACAEGGIYDHLGGGFSRYSVDERWLVPHFEKMLYDNAQLLELLALAHARTGKPLFATRARETVGWLAREMTTARGRVLRLRSTPIRKARRASSTSGRWPRSNKCSARKTPPFLRATTTSPRAAISKATTSSTGSSACRPTTATESRLAVMRAALLAARARRVRPGLDDKVLADWNGLMIAALVNAGLLIGEPGWLGMARRAFDFIAREMTRGDRLGHSWRAGRLLVSGARVRLRRHDRGPRSRCTRPPASASISSARSPGNPRSIAIMPIRSGGYFLTADDAEGLVLRPRSTTDDALPNPNALVAQNLVRLAVLTGDPTWRTKADQLFDALLPGAAENLYSHLALLNALDLRLRAAELVAVGREADRFAAAALKLPFLDRIVLRADKESDLPSAHPARAAFASLPETAMLVCVGERCSLPVTQPEMIAEAVRGMRTGMADR